MNKRGLIFAILIVLAVVVVVGIGIAVYFYNFYVFKTLKVCISDEVQELPVVCESDEQCIKTAEVEISDAKEALEKMPEFMKGKLDEVLEKAVFCEKVCKIKKIRGLENIGEIENCEEGEQEVKIEIRGREGIEILKFLSENENILK